MLRRTLVFLGMVAIVCALGMVATPRALAQCAPEPGTGSSTDDTVTCNGDDADGVNVGTGTDLVMIVDGTVMDAIVSEGGALTVIISGNGALNSVDAGISMTAGSVVSQGDMTTGDYAIIIAGSGSIFSTGDVVADVASLFIGASGTVTSVGNLTAGDFGIYILNTGTVNSTGTISNGDFGIFIGDGSITSNGDVSGSYAAMNLKDGGTVNSTGTLSGGTYGMYIGGNGNVTTNGDVSGGTSGIFISKNGTIQSTGAVSGGVHGFFIGANGNVTSLGNVSGGEYGMYIGGDGMVNSTGNITGGDFGIFISGGGSIVSVGDVTGGAASGIFLDEEGSITSVGNVTGGTNGIYLGGDGSISVEGSVQGGSYGIRGGNGDQMVEVDGTVHAPIAIALADGNDSLYVHQNSSVYGSIMMEGGDDTVIVGDRARIDSTILGGETNEVVGDLLVIGDGQVCTEDIDAVANALSINDLDPNAGIVYYLGQAYTWAEFEQIVNGSYFNPCVGMIRDGRINAYDLGAPDALYCTVEHGVSVWEIDLEGQGTFTFAVSAEQIQAAVEAAVSSGINQVIASDGLGNQLYALSDGENLVFLAPELREPGKTYQFMFRNDRCA